MHSIIGRSLVLLALAVAAAGAVLGMWSGRRGSAAGLRWTERAAYVFSAAMALANFTMVSALLSHDFSVSYVQQVGSRSTPTWVTIVSLWSSLEGSILFWGLILGGYIASFTYTLRNRYREYMPYALGTILLVSCFFAFLIAGPANPFMPVAPVADGPGPNPLLQNHVLMIIHPPSLYLGYVGMTIPFGIAVAALLKGSVTDGWLKPLRRWTLIPWTFLSIGIVLGGWWAYEVLGWGGYWAWDPVENASFLPWLAATGYLHATVVQERKRIMRAWTLALVLCAFILTILGTFLTRSGVFNSVHAFGQNLAIGMTFLVFLGVVTIGSLGLLSGRAHLLESEGAVQSPLSREAAFVLNNIVFVVFTFTVLLGTVFPVVVEAVKGTKISVGEPYFNSMAVPIGLVLVFLMGVGPALPWGRPQTDAVVRRFIGPVLAGALVAGVAVAFGLTEPISLCTFALCGFAGAVTLWEILEPALVRRRDRHEGLALAFARSLAGSRRRVGGYVVHLAVIVTVAAIAASQTYRYSVEASLDKGEQFVIGEYQLTYLGAGMEAHPHRESVFADLVVTRNGVRVAEVKPKLNYYPTQREPIGTPHVETLGGHDLYLSLLHIDPKTEHVAVKAYVIPGVPWIWWSLPVLVLGSLVSLWPRRRRAAATRAPAGAAASPA